jgi:hypothetical protein
MPNIFKCFECGHREKVPGPSDRVDLSSVTEEELLDDPPDEPYDDFVCVRCGSPDWMCFSGSKEACDNFG